MGSIFSKLKDKQSKRTKERAGKNTPRHADSTQSLNIPTLGSVSTNPTPNAYTLPEVRHTLPRAQSLEAPMLVERRCITQQTQAMVVPRSAYSTQSLNNSTYMSVSTNPAPSTYSQPEATPIILRSQCSEATVIAERRCITDQKRAIVFPPKTENNSRVPGDQRTLQQRQNAGNTHSESVYHSPNLKYKPKVKATMDSDTNSEEVLSFKKGDIMELINDEELDGCYLVKNVSTGREGRVSIESVQTITSDDMTSQAFFFQSNKEEAEEKLQKPGLETGTYLIRRSTEIGAYALSLRCESEIYEVEIKHYKIRVVDKGVCYIDADTNVHVKPFSNIMELITYYTENAGLRCKLKTSLHRDVSLDDLNVKITDFTKEEKLGSGHYGTVFAGTLHGHKQVAVKCLKAGGSMTVDEFRKEAETMHKLRHPNLVSLLAICDGNCELYIITERMSKGDLLTLLRKDTGSTVKFKDLMEIAIQVLEGMCHLELNRFVHRDLRAANVLVGEEYITKIADFGLARLLDQYYEHEDYYKSKKVSVFPYKWTAPEAIKQQKFTVKSDVWCFGILLYEMVTYGDEPYAAMSNREALDYLENGNRLKRPTERHCPATLYNIMKQCWLKNPDERPNFADIKETISEIKT